MHYYKKIDPTHIGKRFQYLKKHLSITYLLQIYDTVLKRLKKAYQQVLNRIGDPLDEKTLIGPLHSHQSLNNYLETINQIKAEKGVIEVGGRVRIIC